MDGNNPGGIRGIDADRINALVNTAQHAAETAVGLLDAVREQGIRLEVKVFTVQVLAVTIKIPAGEGTA